MAELRRYESLKEFHLEVIGIINSLPKEQTELIVDKLSAREDIQKYIRNYGAFPDKVQSNSSAVFTLYAMAGMFEEALSMVAKLPMTARSVSLCP